MKTLCLSLLVALAVGTVPVSGQTIAAAPSPAPAASPLPAIEPEPAAAGTPCPGCGMDPAKCAEGSDPAKGGAADKDQAAKNAGVEKAVLQLEADWCEAEARHDAAYLEKVEADSFVFTDAIGKLSTKKDEIAEAHRGGEKIEFKLSDMKAHLYGDTVVLTGQTSFNAAETGDAPSAFRWTDVFVRQANGEWQVVASQATAVAHGTGASEDQSE